MKKVKRKCGQETLPADNLRPLKAATIVLAILLAVPGADAVARFASGAQVANASSPGIDAGYLTGAGDAQASLDRIEELAEAGSADVPQAFAEEVGFLPDARDIRANGDGSVVGYTVPHGSADTLDLLAEQMETAGWTTVSLGEVEGATFVKESGACRWALATCTQVGSSTSVVVRSVVS